MLERIPARYRTPEVARAVVSPSAILAAGAAVAVVVVAGGPVALAGLAGAAAWLARVALAGSRRGGTERIDAFTLSEPWRGFVKEAQSAQARFERVVSGTRGGPLRDRLGSIGGRIDDGVAACWRVANQGQVLQRAMGGIDVRAARAELASVTDELHDAPTGRRDSLEQTKKAVEAQVASYERMGATWQDARDKLRVLTARLDEALARAVELSVHADVTQADPLASDVESVVGDLEALRAALDETDQASRRAVS